LEKQSADTDFGDINQLSFLCGKWPLLPAPYEKSYRYSCRGSFPLDSEEGKQYLGELGVAIQDIRQEKLGSFGVHGTPTLILVDNKGTIIRTWVGKVTADVEEEILSRID